MAGFSSTLSNPNMSGARGDQFGESLEKNIQTSKPTQNQSQSSTASDSYGAWNAFLNPDTVKIERFDTTPTISVTPTIESYPATSTTDGSYVVAEPERIPTFDEIFARISSEHVSSTKQSEEVVITESSLEMISENSNSQIEGTLSFSESAATINLESDSRLIDSHSEMRNESVNQSQEEKHTYVDKTEDFGEKTSGSLFFNKEKVMGSAENISNVTTKTLSLGLKGGKTVFGAIKDIWKSYIYMKEKKPDPKAKENAEKAAKRKAHKLRFISLLKEGMAIYQAEARKALIELQVKLGVHALGTEDRNRLLGRSRNASFEGNETVYGIHQTAFAMMEQRKRQKEASKPRMTSRGKASMGQIFTDKNMSGERTAGGNMMSAVG